MFKHFDAIKALVTLLRLESGTIILAHMRTSGAEATQLQLGLPTHFSRYTTA